MQKEYVASSYAIYGEKNKQKADEPSHKIEPPETPELQKQPPYARQLPNINRGVR